MELLNDTITVIAGGTGSMGEGIVRACMTEGGTVIVPYRSDRKRESLSSYVSDVGTGSLHLLPADICDRQSVSAFLESVVREFGAVDLAVACLGSWYFGYRLHLMPDQDWDGVVKDNLTSHFRFMQTLMQYFHRRNDGTCMMINGSACEKVMLDSGVVSVFAAAQLMMARVFAEEAKGTNVRVHAIIACSPVKTRDRRTQVQSDWPSAEQIGTYIARLYRHRTLDSAETIHRIDTEEDVLHKIETRSA